MPIKNQINGTCQLHTINNLYDNLKNLNTKYNLIKIYLQFRNSYKIDITYKMEIFVLNGSNQNTVVMKRLKKMQ